MTVVPDDEHVQLICDACGDTLTGTAPVLPDAEIVWLLLTEHGWVGSPIATGPHRCPRCEPVPSDLVPSDPVPPAAHDAPHREARQDVQRVRRAAPVRS